MTYARLLRYARRREGLSQRELTERSGIAQPSIARIEAGRITPRFDTWEALVRACGFRPELAPIRGAGVDRTMIREILDLTPEDRVRRAAEEARNLDAFDASVRRPTGGEGPA